ncbi:MAG: RluA family pseudouridine synthase, partial [Roseimicrobium sp.]
RSLTKLYLAAINGLPTAASGRIENRLGRHPVDRKRMTTLKGDAGKEAVTEWEQLSEHEGCALILCRLLTGRTHQIRVHMREGLHAAILGDPIYAQPQRQRVEVPRLMLHAWKLEFTHPMTQEMLRFEAPVPEPFAPWR